MKYLISLFVLASVIAAGAARADDADEFSKNGAYIGVGASYGVPLFSNSLEDAFPGHAHVSNTWGANGRLGYRFHKYMAVEGEYEWLNHFGARVGGASVGSAELQTYTANFKAIAPYGHFQPYVLAGFGVTFASLDRAAGTPIDFSHTSYSTRFGLGLDYYFTPNVALNLGSEFVVNTAKISNTIDGDGGSRGFDYFAAQGGLLFKF
jgi:opacity protein-like surface antigen